MKYHLIAIVLLATLFPNLTGQEGSYIMKREMYKTGPSSINFSPDGKLLLAGFTDGSFRVLDPETFQVSVAVEGAHPKAVTAMDMPPKMDFIMTAGGKQIKVWDRTGKHIGNFTGHATTIWNTDISSDGKHAVSSAFNKTFLLWDVYNGVIAEHMRGHEDVTLSVCISPDNRLIASGSNDLTIKIWDLETRQVITTLHGPTQDVYDIAFSPDSRMVAAASRERTIRIYNVEEEKLVHLLKGHRGAVRKLAFSPDGRYMVSASEDHALLLWDVVTGDRIHAFLDNEEILLDVEFHPGGDSFYSISKAGDLTRWELHPEIFVVRYLDTPYREELSADPIFGPKQKGEAKKDYLVRQAEADK
ncbi:MAG: WD40 repeat domain-containing protein, partial [Bacteroidales bacterium]|nr:WD40 repeat domain-containing protein [Bacteroidales bacterium]